MELSTAATGPAQLAYDAPSEVHDALSAMGRTEDVRLSPSCRRIAFACYGRDEIAVASIAVNRVEGAVDTVVSDLVFHGSRSLSNPHGVEFLDDELLVVANRGGTIELLALPPIADEGVAIPVGSTVCELGAVGSVRARRVSAGEHEVFAAHNWANAVTRYRIADDCSIVGGEVVASRYLDLPDGLAVSGDGRWLAVSNHNTHDVLIFDITSTHGTGAPVGVLRGAMYPHGLRFAHDDALLLVADAGSPYVDVFQRAGDSWATASYPLTSIRVMSDDTFFRGRRNPMEGGPKGIDIDRRSNVLLVTAEEMPVAFFDIDLALQLGTQREDGALVRQELERLDDLERCEAAATEARELLRAIEATKAWRATKPARSALAALRRLRGS